MSLTHVLFFLHWCQKWVSRWWINPEKLHNLRIIQYNLLIYNCLGVRNESTCKILNKLQNNIYLIITSLESASNMVSIQAMRNLSKRKVCRDKNFVFCQVLLHFACVKSIIFLLWYNFSVVCVN